MMKWRLKRRNILVSKINGTDKINYVGNHMFLGEISAKRNVYPVLSTACTRRGRTSAPQRLVKCTSNFRCDWCVIRSTLGDNPAFHYIVGWGNPVHFTSEYKKILQLSESIQVQNRDTARPSMHQILCVHLFHSTKSSWGRHLALLSTVAGRTVSVLHLRQWKRNHHQGPQRLGR
jgi:hypothetical protein